MASAEITTSADEALQEKLTLGLGRMLIASGLFFMIPFFVSYAMLTVLNNNDMWLPHGVTHPSMALGAASAILLVLSALSFYWGRTGSSAGNQGQLTGGLTLALLLAIAAAICYVLTLGHLGFSLQAGGYVSVFFGMTLVYEILLVGLCIFLFGFANRARLGLYTQTRGVALKAFGEYWTWFVIMGVIAYLVLYFLPFLNIETS